MVACFFIAYNGRNPQVVVICGYRKAVLTVWERNKRSIRFYEKNGFKMTGEKTEKYPGIDV